MNPQAFTGWVLPNPQQQNVSLITVADSPYAVDPLDVFIGVNSTGGAITVDLPSAASAPGRVIEIYDVDGFANTNNITVQPDGAELISGAASQTISTAYGGITVVSDGTNWEIVSSAGGGSGGTPVLTLVETKIMSAAASTTFSGLDGDADEIYFLEGELTSSAGSQVAIYPNGNSGNVCAGSYLATNSGGGPPSSAAMTQILFPASTTLSGVSRVTFWCRIDAESRSATLQQLFQWQALTRFQGPISFQTLSENGGNSFNASPIANLTSIDVAAVAGTLTGKVSLYKLSRT